MRFDPMHQHRPRPAIHGRLLRIPQTVQRTLEFRDELNILTPGNLCHRYRWARTGGFSNDPLENCPFRFSNGSLENLHLPGPCQVECPHIPDVLRRESCHARKILLDVGRQSHDYGLAPSLQALPGDDQLPNIPIELDELSIDRQVRLDLRYPDTSLNVVEQPSVAVR